jgi:hypothetical protein
MILSGKEGETARGYLEFNEFLSCFDIIFVHA